MEALALFFESFELFQSAIFAAVIAGFVLGFVGVFIAAQRIIFVSAAMSQTASLGVVLAFWLQSVLFETVLFSPSLWAFVLTFLAVLILERTTRRDETLGVLFLVGSAGTLALATHVSEELHDVSTLLFGTAVAVPDGALWELGLTLLLVLVVHLWWFRGFVAVSTDPVGAKVRKLPTVVLQFTLLATIALSISVTTRILGALPAFAFSVLPGISALSVARSFKGAVMIAPCLGCVGGFVGYFVAYLYDLPVGASQTLVLLTLFVLSKGFAAVR